MYNIRISIVVAMAENGCIGKDNHMPWHISADLKRFKTLTMGHPVIMGRKTFESIQDYLGGPLPGRDNLVISRSGFEAPAGVFTFSNIQDAVKSAKETANKNNLSEVFIVGGAQIYAQSITDTDCLHLTKIHKHVDGDAFFPTINEADWQETKREDHLEHDPPYSFITLLRR